MEDEQNLRDRCAALEKQVEDLLKIEADFEAEGLKAAGRRIEDLEAELTVATDLARSRCEEYADLLSQLKAAKQRIASLEQELKDASWRAEQRLGDVESYREQEKRLFAANVEADKTNRRLLDMIVRLVEAGLERKEQ